MLYRYEYDLSSGIRTEINQRVYRNSDEQTIILDEGTPIPPGFREIEDYDQVKTGLE